MDPATATVIAGAISGGSDIFSSWQNRKAQKQANIQNIWYNYLQQQDERAYNHPKAQMARLEEAGLNPNLIYGNGAGSLTSRTVSATPVQAPKVNYKFDALGALSMYQNLKLGQEQIDSILLEGGGTLNWAALESGVVQQVQAYIAPKLFGGQEAKTPVEGAGVPMPSAAFRLKNSSLTHLGEDILIESEVEYPCSPEL